MTRICRRWSPEELEILFRKYPNKQNSLEQIAAELDRSPMAVCRKAREQGLRREKLEIKRGEGGRWKQSGVAYKKVVPPEQWSMARHFMVTLVLCAEIAREAGVKPDVGRFMSEYGGHTENSGPRGK